MKKYYRRRVGGHHRGGFTSILAVSFVLVVIFFALSQSLTIATRSAPDVEQQLNSLRAEYLSLAAQEFVNAALAQRAATSTNFNAEAASFCATLVSGSTTPQVVAFTSQGVTLSQAPATGGSIAYQCAIKALACVGGRGAGCPTSEAGSFFAKRSSSVGTSIENQAGVAGVKSVFSLTLQAETSQRIAVINAVFDRKDGTSGGTATATCSRTVASVSTSCPADFSWDLTTTGAQNLIVGDQGQGVTIPAGSSASVSMSLSAPRFGSMTGLVFPAAAVGAFNQSVYGSYAPSGGSAASTVCDNQNNCWSASGPPYTASKTLTNGFFVNETTTEVTPVVLTSTPTGGVWSLTLPRNVTLEGNRLSRVTLWGAGGAGGSRTNTVEGAGGGGGGGVTVLQGNVDALTVTDTDPGSGARTFNFYVGVPAGGTPGVTAAPTFFSKTPVSNANNPGATITSTAIGALANAGVSLGADPSLVAFGDGGAAWTNVSSPSVSAAGGRGATPPAGGGGGGGSSAGSAEVAASSTATVSIGSNASGSTGGAAVSGATSGAGGNGAGTNASGNTGSTPGGGGGGARRNNTNNPVQTGGSGGAGQLTIQYRTVSASGDPPWCRASTGHPAVGADLLIFSLGGGTEITSNVRDYTVTTSVVLSPTAGFNIPLQLLAHYPQAGLQSFEGSTVQAFSEIFFLYNPYIYGSITSVDASGGENWLTIACSGCATPTVGTRLKAFDGVNQVWMSILAIGSNPPTGTLRLRVGPLTSGVLADLVSDTICGGVCALLAGLSPAATTPYTVTRSARTQWAGGFICARAGTIDPANIRFIPGSTRRAGTWGEEVSD